MWRATVVDSVSAGSNIPDPQPKEQTVWRSRRAEPIGVAAVWKGGKPPLPTLRPGSGRGFLSLPAYDSTGARCGRSRPGSVAHARVIAPSRRCLGEKEPFECASVPPFSCQARGLLCPPRGTCEMTNQGSKKQKQTPGESSSAPPPVEKAPRGVGQTGRSPEPDNKHAKRSATRRRLASKAADER